MIYSVKDGGGIPESNTSMREAYPGEHSGAGAGAGCCNIYGRGVSCTNPYKHYNTPESFGGGCGRGDCTAEGESWHVR